MVVATSCPTCGSNDVRTKTEYGRKVRTLRGVETFVITQHCCRHCQTTFTDEVEGVKHGCQIADEVKRKAVTAYMDGPDLEGVRRRLDEDFNAKVSTSTVWRAVNLAAKAAHGSHQLPDLQLSRFACVDEKYISVHGRKRPQLFAVCAGTGLPVAQKLLRRKDEAAIRPEFRKLKGMGFEVCVTDDWKAYPAVVRGLGMRHQKCHFHAKRACFRIMEKKRIQKRRRKKFLGWLFKFLDSEDLARAKVWLRVIGRMKAEKKLRRFLKSFLADWRDYFTYLEFPGCPKTSNPIEHFNRQFEQKRQTMHGFRKERTAKAFTDLFSLHYAFRKFETGVNKGRSPLELAGMGPGRQSMFDCLPL